ncbi:MAG: PIN domain-containing protein, partial [Rhodospirillaceae bacterium]|nr:PIN domain-containing protein [Rhodospirillaceae bacterium]
LIGNALFLEYEDVLSREKLFAAAPVDPADLEALLDAFLGACQWIEIAFLWRPNLPDEADNHPVELAVAGNASEIVTHNAGDLAAGDLAFDGIRIVAPGDLLKEERLTWRP